MYIGLDLSKRRACEAGLACMRRYHLLRVHASGTATVTHASRPHMSFRTTSAHALPWCLLQLARLEAIKWCVVVAVVLCCVDTIGRSDIPAVAYCSWSFCNYAAASLGYPTFTTRMADCPGQVRAW